MSKIRAIVAWVTFGPIVVFACVGIAVSIFDAWQSSTWMERGLIGWTVLVIAGFMFLAMTRKHPAEQVAEYERRRADAAHEDMLKERLK